MGKESKYDLKLAEPIVGIGDVESGTDSNDDEEDTTATEDEAGLEDSIIKGGRGDQQQQPSKMLRSACIRLMRFISVSFALHSVQVCV